MRLKSVLLATVLAIFTLSMTFAKTYDVSFNSATKVGSVQLKAGDYHLKLDGNKATFTDANSNKSVTTDVKVENSDKKFDQTLIDSTNDGGTNVVKDIELGGSKIKIDF
ncbi:MAG: hypothetical protein ABSF25_27190 [Bryobacteraceae bacterium]|jgi:hypothetical protein